MTDQTPQAPMDGVILAAGRVTLFGFDPTAAIARIRPRGRRWRVGGAARTLGVFLVIAPVVAIVPPHAPWGIGALVVGVVLARRRLVERFTLVAVDGACPKCDEALQVKRSRLRTPHAITCEGCHHQASLEVPSDLLE